MKKLKIETKISSEKESDWNELIQLLVNEMDLDFYLTEGKTAVHIYTEGDSGWSIALEKSGGWHLE